MDWLDANLTRDDKSPHERWTYVGPEQPEGPHGVRVARDTMCVVVDGDTVHMWGLRDGRCAAGRTSRPFDDPHLVAAMSEVLDAVSGRRTQVGTTIDVT